MSDIMEALKDTITDKQPSYQPPKGDWSPERLHAWVSDQFPKHIRDGGKYRLPVCPFCGEAEGAPAIWLKDGLPVFDCRRSNKCVPKKTFTDLQALYPPRLARINARDLVTNYKKPRQEVIEGWIRRGDVANFIGGPKARKSFLLMQLALCVAAGVPLLGRNTVRGRVLLIDNELRPDDLSRRVSAMLDALGLTVDDVADYFELLPLRGKLADLHTIRDEVCSQAVDSYSLIICDAFYKMLPAGCDENSNSNMTSAYVLLDETAEKQNAAIAVVHHTSKGSQHAKSVSDMGAGAGAQSRSADVHCVLREHEDPNTIVLQTIVRSQKPIEPFCITFSYPIWELAADKDPTATAVINKKPVPTIEAFVQTIPLEPTQKVKALASSKRALGATRETMQILMGEAIAQGLVSITTPKNKNRAQLIHRVNKAA